MDCKWIIFTTESIQIVFIKTEILYSVCSFIWRPRGLLSSGLSTDFGLSFGHWLGHLVTISPCSSHTDCLCSESSSRTSDQSETPPMMFPHPYFTVGRLGLKSKIIISNLNFEVVEVWISILFLFSVFATVTLNDTHSGKHVCLGWRWVSFLRTLTAAQISRVLCHSYYRFPTGAACCSLSLRSPSRPPGPSSSFLDVFKMSDET